jgi:putative flippase GtrA
MAFILSVFVGFYLQKYVTFKNTSLADTKRQAILFFIVSSVNLGINVLLMLFLVGVLNLDKMLSKVITLLILACWNFFVYQKIVFKIKKNLTANAVRF